MRKLRRRQVIMPLLMATVTGTCVWFAMGSIDIAVKVLLIVISSGTLGLISLGFATPDDNQEAR